MKLNKFHNKNNYNNNNLFKIKLKSFKIVSKICILKKRLNKNK
jgi:hypothetical protein